MFIKILIRTQSWLHLLGKLGYAFEVPVYTLSYCGEKGEWVLESKTLAMPGKVCGSAEHSSKQVTEPFISLPYLKLYFYLRGRVTEGGMERGRESKRELPHTDSFPKRAATARVGPDQSEEPWNSIWISQFLNRDLDQKRSGWELSHIHMGCQCPKWWLKPLCLTHCQPQELSVW